MNEKLDVNVDIVVDNLTKQIAVKAAENAYLVAKVHGQQEEINQLLEQNEELQQRLNEQKSKSTK